MGKQKQVDIIDSTEAETDYFYYRGQQLVNIIQGQGRSQPGQRFFQTATGLAAQMNVGGNAGTWLIGADALGSVLAGSDGKDAPEEHCYTPYGGEKHQGSTENVMKLGYTGAYRDPLTGLYPLGNGYRFYLPELMCFNKADSLSPFGAGGINTRSYCEGDPINRSDPSGHIGKGVAGVVIDLAEGLVGTVLAITDPAIGVVEACEVVIVEDEAAQEAAEGAAKYFEGEPVDNDIGKVAKQERIDEILEDLKRTDNNQSPISSTKPKTQEDLASISTAKALKRSADELGEPLTKHPRYDSEVERRRKERKQENVHADHFDNLTVEQFINKMYGDLSEDMSDLTAHRDLARYLFNEAKPGYLQSIGVDPGMGENMLQANETQSVHNRVEFSIKLMENPRGVDATIKELRKSFDDKTRRNFKNYFTKKLMLATLWFR